MNKKKVIEHYNSAIKNVWLFPVLLIIVLLTLTCLKISGTSSGVYHDFLYGTTTKDKNLIIGRSETVRSDEWLAITQVAIAQEKNGFARMNPHFQDKDMSILMDAPYIEWSAIFKPQNFPFFLLPLEYAFALKWWLLLLSLLLSVYYFCLKILPGKIVLSVLMSIIIGFSPFVFWWYQSATILPLTYGFLILTVGMSIINGTNLHFRNKKMGNKVSATLKSLTLGYLLTSFALILYPPFQIPVAIVVGLFLVGYLLNQPKKDPKKHAITISITLLSALVIVVIACGVFVATRSEAIHTIASTAYPGERIVESGDYDIKRLLVTYLQPQLQRGSVGSKYLMNQSESSSFVLLPLFFALPACCLLAWVYIKHKKVEWILFGILLSLLLFLVQLFIPGIDWISKISLLYLVPHGRLLLGLGFVSIILVAYMIKLATQYVKFNTKISLSILTYTVLFFLWSLWAGFATSALYPEFISSETLIILLASILFIGLGLLLFNKVRTGLIIIALFSLGSVVYVNPLYKGLGPLYNSEVSRAIQDVSNESDTWGAADDTLIENLPQLSGRSAVTGVAYYPNNSFWKEYSDSDDDYIYNRYAHILLSSEDTASLALSAADSFKVSISCTRKINEKIDYIVSTKPLDDACRQLVRTIHYPKTTFYLYKQ